MHPRTGSKVEIPADSLVDLDGNEYNGDYKLGIAFIDSTDKKSWRAMPDAFIGYLNGENKVHFETLNAIHIDLKTPEGAYLNLK